MNIRWLLLGLALVASGPAGAEERLAMRVSPAVAFAPANLIVRTQVLANQENRAMTVSAESPDFYRSSEIQLDGERAPRTTIFEFKNLPGGIYEVTAVLRGSRGEELASTFTRINVVSSGADRM